MVWVYMGDNQNPVKNIKLPLLQEIDEEEGWHVSTHMRDLHQDVATLLENTIDSYHVPFTHHDTFGNRENAVPVKIEGKSFGKAGFTGLEIEPGHGIISR